jgi:hypothetical protein
VCSVCFVPQTRNDSGSVKSVCATGWISNPTPLVPCRSRTRKFSEPRVINSLRYQHTYLRYCLKVCSYCNVLVGVLFHDGTLLHSKSKYTTVKHTRKLLEHTYTSNPHGLGTLTPIEFFQQDLLWQSSNTRSHSCGQKAFKHTSGQSIVGLSVRLHTTTAPRRIVHH